MHCSMQRQNATVTVVHSHTPNPAEITREADIVVAAVGKAELVRGDWLKPGAVVIDVGINSVEVCTLLFSYLFKISARTSYRVVGGGNRLKIKCLLYEYDDNYS